MNDDTIKQVFGSKPIIEILLLFESDRDLLLSMTELGKRIGRTHVTIKIAVTKLIDAKILDMLQFGTTKVMALSKSKEATIVMNIIKSIREEVPMLRRIIR